MPLDAPTDIIKVAPDSSVKRVAGAIDYALKNSDGEATVQAIGAGAVNQAVKAIAIARGTVATRGKDLWARHGFESVRSTRNGGSDELSVIVFHLRIF